MARQDEQRNLMPARQQEGQGRLLRSPWGMGESDWWSASPFQMMRRMQEDMDRMMGSFWGQPGGEGSRQGIMNWSPSVDVYEDENELVVKAEVPGVEPEDLDVTCTEDALVIRGETRREEQREVRGWRHSERRFGRFERQIPLPPGVRPDEARANFRNGILELRIPKSEESRQRVRRIPITGAMGAKGGSVEGQAPGQQPQREQAAGQQPEGGGSSRARK